MRGVREANNLRRPSRYPIDQLDQRLRLSPQPRASCPIVRRFNVWRTLLRAKLGSSEAIRRLVDLGLAEGEKMNNRRLTLLAHFLISFWLLANCRRPCGKPGHEHHGVQRWRENERHCARRAVQIGEG
jgi:hypothetical protein